MIALATLLVPSCVRAGGRWLVSIPRLEVTEVPVPGAQKLRRESIVGIKATVNGGAIASLPEVPVGWNIVVDNDPSWNTSLTATVIVASAALDPESLARKFAVISKSPASVWPALDPPEVHGELAVSADYEHQRRLIFGPKEVSLRSKVPHDRDTREDERQRRTAPLLCGAMGTL